jgi:hypothetical protein
MALPNQSIVSFLFALVARSICLSDNHCNSPFLFTIHLLFLFFSFHVSVLNIHIFLSSPCVCLSLLPRQIMVNRPRVSFHHCDRVERRWLRNQLMMNRKKIRSEKKYNETANDVLVPTTFHHFNLILL